MSNTLQQHHFNSLIYYAGEEFALETALKSTTLRCKELEKQISENQLSQDVVELFKQRKSIRPETHLAGKQSLDQDVKALEMAQKFKLCLEQDLNTARQQILSYLSKYADDKVRPEIRTLIENTKSGIQTIKLDNQPYWIDHNAYTQFIDQLSKNINLATSHEYKYEPPISNYLIISFLAHPIVRGINSLSLMAGLAATAIGIIAATGVITGLPVTTVTALIGGGALATVSGFALITCSFFRQRSPEELADRSEKISVPNMMQPDSGHTLNSAPDSSHEQIPVDDSNTPRTQSCTG